MRPLGYRLLTACLVLLTAGPAPAGGAREKRNLVVNGGFEVDDDNLHGERMSCPVRARVTYGQADGIPDGWTYPARQALRTRASRSGAYALRVLPGKPVPLTPTVLPYAAQLKGQAELPPLAFSAWAKGGGGKDALDVTLTLTLQENDPKAKKDHAVVFHTLKKTFNVPPQWTRVAFVVSSADIAAALKKRSQPAGQITAGLTLQASSTVQGLTLDDVELLSPGVPAPYTLIPNAGFEALDREGRPTEWTLDRKSLRAFGSGYYVWRDWYHYLGVNRGKSEVDRLVVRGGRHALRMNVPPGDDRHLQSAAVALNQKEPRRLLLRFDYNSYLLANLMVQVVDEQGKEIFAQNIVPGTSGGWRTHSVEFLARRAALKPGSLEGSGDLYGPTGDPVPVKACRVRLGVKGVNGSAMDDVNEWVNVNHAGVLWLDNVVLAEVDSVPADLAARGVKTYPVDTTGPALTVERIDLGERLFGENVARVTLANRGGKPVSGTVTLTLSGPYREDDPKKSGRVEGAVGQRELEPPPPKLPEQTVTAKYSVGPGGRAAVELSYRITQLLPSWRSEYCVKIGLDRERACEIPLGTWSQQALVEVMKCYPFAEDKVQPVFLNLGVARKTLAQVERLRLEVCRARDDKPAFTKEVPDFPRAAAGFNLAPLPEGYEGDNTNFFLTEFPLDRLPVHPQTRPVRDHYVHVAGLDRAGKVVFEGRSPRFGRMEAHSEKLDPIKDVRVHPDNYLLINGKPFFTRGHIWMQQNFGPSPFARKNTDWKRYGFNVRAAVQTPLPEVNKADPRYGAGVDDLWAMHNTYLGSQMVDPKGPLTNKVRADVRKWLAKPNVIGIHFVPWEGHPQDPPAQSVAYARALKKEIGTRPLWISAGWYAPAVSGQLDGWQAAQEHDWFMPENNSYFQPSQLDKEILPWRKGRPCVLGTYPNVFNDTPYHVQRFEQWTEIIRGHTGYMQIGKPGDPSLMAGMNGEFRFLESFLWSKDRAPPVKATPEVEHLVRARGGRTYILASNAGPVIGGDWEWSTKLKDRGKAAHTGSAFWNRLHGFLKDYSSHWYRDDRPFLAAKGDLLVQYVYLPQGAPVENLMLMARADGLWRHHAVWGKFDHKGFTESGARLWLALDMHPMSWGTLGLGFCGPEGHNPRHPALLRDTFTAAQFRRLGELPRAGVWVRLEVPVEKLGLEGKLVDGFAFVSKGAKVWWERTLLVRGGKERALCDGSAGIHPAALKRVRFEVQGLKAGTRVKVCFEEREIVARDGYFEDDLSGEPGYRNLWVGLYGDKIGETGYYGDGVFYNYNWGKVAARLYEVPR
jgi:hypothetical protein